jgi:DNA-binding NtrC family response regulator
VTRILVVDDDDAVRFTIVEALAGPGRTIVECRSGGEALPQLEGADVVVTDLAMPGIDGLELLGRARATDPSCVVVLVTAHGSEKIAVRAMKDGAFDYVAKPFDVEELRCVIARAIETRSLRRTAGQRDVEIALGLSVVAESPGMRRVLDAATRVARRDVPVLVLGETGTGKEIVASILHAASPRAQAPLIRFNCAAIPTELAEAELFGHVKGAFTGATSARAGLFARANGGTIVLDEVGELPLAVQAKMLRATQSGEIQPVGAGGVDRVDVRIVACTHRDLRADASAGRFREDLYFRLAVVELTVPPLRHRIEDVGPLARAFAVRHGARMGFDAAHLDEALVRALEARAWPGNVRELESAVQRMLALSEDGRVGLDALSWLSGAAPTPPKTAGTWREQVDRFERELLLRTLDACGGNQSEAARRLGLSRPTLIDKMKRFAAAAPGDPDV